MGHYASEMMCDKCGYVSCRCVPVDKSNLWMVDGTDFAVMQVKTFDEKYRYIRSERGTVIPGTPELRRFGCTLFDSYEEAMAHREVVADQQIERAVKNAALAEIELARVKAKKAKILK